MCDLLATKYAIDPSAMRHQGMLLPGRFG